MSTLACAANVLLRIAVRAAPWSSDCASSPMQLACATKHTHLHVGVICIVVPLRLRHRRLKELLPALQERDSMLLPAKHGRAVLEQQEAATYRSDSSPNMLYIARLLQGCAARSPQI